MDYRQYTPHPLLARYVQCYWRVEGGDPAGCTDASRERIFPDGRIELIFHYGDLFTKNTSSGVSVIQPRSFVHGQLRSFMEIEATGRVGIFSVRFHPNGLRAFTRCGIQEITGLNVGIRDFWGQAGDELEDRMLHAGSDDERRCLIEQFLIHHLDDRRHDGAVARHVQAIQRSHGCISIEQLAADTPIGRRHLERRFIAEVGLSPKLLARIVRFQHVLALIEQQRFDSLTTLALEGGFYDQAHFIKDFKVFTGLSPKQYFAENLTLTKFFTLT